MRTGFRTPSAAIILLGTLFFCCGVVGQEKTSSVSSEGESSSRPPTQALASQPAEIASTSPTRVAQPAQPVDETKVPADHATPSPLAEASETKPVDDSYIVGIADELQISVWKEPDLSGSVVVRPDGMITVPVVDDVYVVGLTTKQVQDTISTKLKNIVAEPQVTVIVRNIRSRKVYLVGQVGHPGAVSLAGHETILQVLAESGGPNLYAKADKIYILRQTEGHQQRLNFNYKKALKGDPSLDFPLISGDVIVVP